jgi:hypothetical protein
LESGKAFIGAFETPALISHYPSGQIKLKIEGKSIIGPRILLFNTITKDFTNFLIPKKIDSSL